MLRNLAAFLEGWGTVDQLDTIYLTIDIEIACPILDSQSANEGTVRDFGLMSSYNQVDVSVACKMPVSLPLQSLPSCDPLNWGDFGVFPHDHISKSL